MRAVVQRTTQAKVEVDDQIIGQIGLGLTVLLGIGRDDTEQDAAYLADKIINLRIFTDPAGKMNQSLLDINGQLLAVSQFTLYGDCRKGRRPSFDQAAPPEQALALYNCFIENIRRQGVAVECGRFQATMVVSLANDGPVTMLLDSRRSF